MLRPARPRRVRRDEARLFWWIVGIAAPAAFTAGAFAGIFVQIPGPPVSAHPILPPATSMAPPVPRTTAPVAPTPRVAAARTTPAKATPVPSSAPAGRAPAAPTTSTPAPEPSTPADVAVPGPGHEGDATEAGRPDDAGPGTEGTEIKPGP